MKTPNNNCNLIRPLIAGCLLVLALSGCGGGGGGGSEPASTTPVSNPPTPEAKVTVIKGKI